MDLLPVVVRCAALERAASATYAAFAATFAGDADLAALWSALAKDETGHAEKLEAWAALLAAEPPDRRTCGSGFEDAVAELEALLAAAVAQAPAVRDPEEAFRLALALETSELDVVYDTLLHASPLARFPDLAASARHEASGHHGRLIAAVRRRSRDEGNLLRAGLLAAAHGGD